MSTLSRATGTVRARNPRDYYPTIDPRAVVPLVAHLGRDVTYVEPCAGAGDLIDHLAVHGWSCSWASDLVPMRRAAPATGELIVRADIFTLPDIIAAHPALAPPMIVTNPPWERRLLHAIIATCARIAPTWLLFDAAWKETKQAAEFGSWCHTVISVGRLKWVEGSDHQSTDDCSWYGFDARHRGGTTFVWPAPNREPVNQGRLL